MKGGCLLQPPRHADDVMGLWPHAAALAETCKWSSAAGPIKLLLKDERCHLLQTTQVACLLQVNYTGQLFPLKWGVGKIICDVVRAGGRWAALHCSTADSSCTHSSLAQHWSLEGMRFVDAGWG